PDVICRLVKFMKIFHHPRDAILQLRRADEDSDLDVFFIFHFRETNGNYSGGMAVKIELNIIGKMNDLKKTFMDGWIMGNFFEIIANVGNGLNSGLIGMQDVAAWIIFIGDGHLLLPAAVMFHKKK
ncbi:MAG: hypothetical protein KJ717_04135, partial [Proteobacteria bacterium]|nr:hypothetical protein [Pseudomonadota bacterium]